MITRKTRKWYYLAPKSLPEAALASGKFYFIINLACKIDSLLYYKYKIFNAYYIQIILINFNWQLNQSILEILYIINKLK